MSIVAPMPMKNPGDYVEFEDAERLLSSCDNIRDRIIVGLLWRCGLREFEIGRLKWKYLNEKDGTLIVDGKGGTQLFIPLEPELFEWMRQYKSGADTPESYIFSTGREKGMHRATVWRIVRKASVKSGVLLTKANKPLHPHALRHSLAIWMVRMGVPLPKIQQILRHTSLVPTTYYLQFSMKELAEDYLNAWKKAKNPEP